MVASSNTVALEHAKKILDSTAETTNELVGLYSAIKGAKKGPGTSQQQDLLRATLVLVCAGLDSFLKQIVDDCIDLVRQKNSKSKEFFNNEFKSLLKDQEGHPNYDLIANSLMSGDPVTYAVKRVKSKISAGSLQSYKELQKILRAFGIDENIFVEQKAEIHRLFAARNNIAHKFDFDFGILKQGKKHRVQRAKDDIEGMINIAVSVMKKIYEELETTFKQGEKRRIK